MNRGALRSIGLLVTLALGFLVVPLAAHAQPPKHVPRLGFLSAASAERDQSRLAGLQQGLHELGYVEGTNILIERRYAAGQLARLPDLAADLIHLQVDIFVVGDKPRQNIVYLSAERSRPCWTNVTHGIYTP
jgi:hypothetical protein